MKYVYASRMGHVEELVKKLNLEATKINDGSEVVDEPFVLFTYTDGAGVIPEVVATFLQKNGKNIQAVVASGNMERHSATFCFAGDKVSEMYEVPCLYKVDGSGTDADVEAISKVLPR